MNLRLSTASPWVRPFLTFASLALTIFLFDLRPVLAQNGKPKLGSIFGEKGEEGGLEFGLGGFGLPGGDSDHPYSLSARYEAEEGGLRGRLHVTVELEAGYSIYSVTQPKGGPLATKIGLNREGVKIEGPFVPDSDPKASTEEPGFTGLRVEKHFDRVTWTAPVVFDKPVVDGASPIPLTVSGQVCKGKCIPIDDEEVAASFQGFYGVAKAAVDGQAFRDVNAKVSWNISFSRSVAKPGETIDLIVAAKADSGFHIYAIRPTDESTESSTVIVLSKKSNLRAGEPIPNHPPVTKELIPGTLSVTFHETDVAWTIPIRIPEESIEGKYPIEGVVGYQACTDDSCEEPLGLKFSGELEVRRDAEAGSSQPLSIQRIPFGEVVSLPQRLTWIDRQSTEVIAGAPMAPLLSLPELLSKFALALFGGFILNLMPCVLPVIGLKVMSFVNEGKQSGTNVTVLNLWYIAGILCVFVALAVLTIAVRSITGQSFGWGEQFGNFGLRLGLTILMFAMALSFLGVWEIPIPGFATSRQSSELMRKEGPTGAFFKGILTTVLATPCAAPGLGVVFSVSIDQPGWVILAMYLVVGLGMSLPYIVIAFMPGAMSFLPKPGPWMQTLKEILAFPMLLSVVWFIAQFSDGHRIAVVTALIFVWMACWWIGKAPVWAEPKIKLRHWGGALLMSSAAIAGSLQYLGPRAKIIEWVPYSATELARLQSEGKTVMIDFTAEWCANCKVNLAWVIETAEVAEVIKKQGIVPMLADWTDGSPEVKKKLHELKSASIPVLAIYPSGKQNEPIVLRDQLTKSGLISALREAGPSQSSVSDGGRSKKKMSRMPVSTSSEPRR